jgi:hypothetical protein
MPTPGKLLLLKAVVSITTAYFSVKRRERVPLGNCPERTSGSENRKRLIAAKGTASCMGVPRIKVEMEGDRITKLRRTSKRLLRLELHYNAFL